MENQQYEPFGEEWRKELRGISNAGLFIMFRIAKQKGTKEEYISKIRSELIIKATRKQ